MIYGGIEWAIKENKKKNIFDYYNKKDRTYILFSWITNEKNDKFIKSNVSFPLHSGIFSKV